MSLDIDDIFQKLKLAIWSISAGTIVAFFFGTNLLSWATNFNPGGPMLFLSPLVCGFILGILTWEHEISHAVFATILLTVTASIWISLILVSPSLSGAVVFFDQYYLYVTQNVILSIVMIFPISLLGSIVGKVLTGSAILSPEYRAERQTLRTETEEWYRMLEEYADSKVDAPPPPDQERIRHLIEEKIKKEIQERDDALEEA